MVSKFTPIQQERPIDLTTRYRDRSRALAMRPSLIGAQNRAQTDVISVAGGLRLLMGVRKLQAASPHVLSPSSIYIHTYIYSEEGSTLPSVLDKMTPRITVQLPFNSRRRLIKSCPAFRTDYTNVNPYFSR